MNIQNKHIVNHCIEGRCSQCGECCADFLPLTFKEVQILKKYIEENNVELTDWDFINPVTQKHETHLLCPLLDKDTKLCKAYTARPNICKTFKCCKNPKIVIKERDAIARASKYNTMDKHSGHITNVYSIYELLTGNKDKTIQLILNLAKSQHTSEIDLDKVTFLIQNVFNRPDISKDDILIYLKKEGR